MRSAVASATSGRAVLISGLTVIAAMAGMLLTGDGTFISFGIGTMLVVAVAMARLADRPACRARRARRPGRKGTDSVPRPPSSPSIGRRSRALGCDRRPGPEAPGALGADRRRRLVGLAIPALSMQMEVAGAESFPRDLAIVQTYDRIEAAFPGENIPAVVVGRGRRRPLRRGRLGDRAAPRRGRRRRPVHGPIAVDDQPRRHRRQDRDPDRRGRQRRRLRAGAGDAAGRGHPERRSPAGRRRDQRHRGDRKQRRLHQPDDGSVCRWCSPSCSAWRSC